MTTSAKFCFLLIHVVTLVRIEGSHFNGGTITYKVLNASESIVSISLTQTYLYTHTVIHCNDTMIGRRSPPLFQYNSSDALICSRHCNSSTEFTDIPISLYCTDYSTTLDITVGQQTDVINLTNGSYFLVAYKSNDWRQLSLPNGSSAISSSVACLINLRIRSNGEYNHPPVSKMISPIYISVGILQPICIPTIDADNDEVRCRFANDSDECGDVCPPASLPNGTKLLSNCTLLITGVNVSDWYAVTIMIEDFVDSMSTDPLSSIPVQFLINVREETNCSLPHLTDESDQCVGVLVGQRYSTQLIVEHSCSNSTTIQDIATLSFPNVIKTPIVQNTTSLWSVSLTWTPTVEQVGLQVLCAVAIDSNNVQSNQYCITFTVAEGSISPCPGETIMPTTESTTDDSTSILMTSASTSDALFTSWYDDQTSVDMKTSSIVDLQQTTATSLTSDVQSTFSTTSTFSTPEPIDSTTNLYKTSSITTLSLETLISSFDFQQMSSTSYQKTDSTNSIVVSPSSDSASPWRWGGPLIAILGGCLIAFCIWCCCCYPSCFCFACHHKRSSIKKINQQSKIIRPPKRSYRVYSVSRNEQNSHRNNVHKAHSLNKTNNRISRTAPKPTHPLLNSIKPDTSTSVTQSYLFGNRHDLKINKK